MPLRPRRERSAPECVAYCCDATDHAVVRKLIRAAAVLTSMDARLRGFGPPGMIAIVVIVAAGVATGPLPAALLILFWRWLSQTPWRELGYVRPTIASIAIAIPLGILFKLVMKAVVMPLLGAPPVNQAYHYLAGNTAAIPAMLFTIVIVAGFGEETLYRGWLFERLGKLLGTSVAAKCAIVIISATLFALAHYAVQGLPGTEQAAIVGLVFGTVLLK